MGMKLVETEADKLENNGAISMGQGARAMPSTESVKAYTKADYIMALHKEYGCTLTMAEEAHNKALEHLRSKARMKG